MFYFPDIQKGFKSCVCVCVVGSKLVRFFFLALLFKFKDMGTNTSSLNSNLVALGVDTHIKQSGSVLCVSVCVQVVLFSRGFGWMSNWPCMNECRAAWPSLSS